MATKYSAICCAPVSERPVCFFSHSATRVRASDPRSSIETSGAAGEAKSDFAVFEIISKRQCYWMIVPSDRCDFKAYGTKANAGGTTKYTKYTKSRLRFVCFVFFVVAHFALTSFCGSDESGCWSSCHERVWVRFGSQVRG